MGGGELCGEAVLKLPLLLFFFCLFVLFCFVLFPLSFRSAFNTEYLVLSQAFQLGAGTCLSWQEILGLSCGGEEIPQFPWQ